MMAHELAHVKNRDTLTMTITATIAGAISMLANFAMFFGGNDNNNRWRDRRAARRHPGAARRDAGADGDQPHARIRRRPRRSGDRGRPLWLASALEKLEHGAQRSTTRRRSITPRRRISSSSIRCTANGIDSLFATHPAPRTGSAPAGEWPRAGRANCRASHLHALSAAGPVGPLVGVARTVGIGRSPGASSRRSWCAMTAGTISAWRH